MKKKIKIPDIGDYKEVEIIEVLISKGDIVSTETLLLSLETEKAVMDVPSPFSGIIQNVSVSVGDKVSQGDVIAIIEVSEKAIKTDIKQAESQIKSEAKLEPTESSTHKLYSQAQQSGKASHASPSVRRFARELGVDLSQVFGVGRKNRILKENVQDYVKQRLNKGAANLPEYLTSQDAIDFSKYGPIQITQLSRIQKISGRNLHRNWVQIPHVTHFDKVDITELEVYRKSEKSNAEKQGVRLTALAFIVKAVEQTLKQFPDFNASLEIEKNNLILKQYYHIGFAADTPNGLVVPVIKSVDEKNVIEIAKSLDQLSEFAREGKLKANQMQGGCFTISSLGGIGGHAFTPIVNMPEVAILGVSRATLEPVYKSNQFVPRLILPLSLSYDHRVIDGAQAARMMQFLVSRILDFKKLI